MSTSQKPKTGSAYEYGKRLLKLGTSIKHIEPALYKESGRRGDVWTDGEICGAIASLRRVADHKRKQKKIYSITDDIEIILNGERYLLESGDRIFVRHGGVDK